MKSNYLSDCLIKGPKLSSMQFHSLNKELQGNNLDLRKCIFPDKAKCGPIDFENINLMAIIFSPNFSSNLDRHYHLKMHDIYKNMIFKNKFWLTIY